MNTIGFKWGVGYRLMREPYQNASDYIFVWGRIPPDNVAVMTTKQACEVISKYFLAHGIRQFHLDIGIMTLELQPGGEVTIKYNKHDVLDGHNKSDTKRRIREQNQKAGIKQPAHVSTRLKRYFNNALNNSIDRQWLSEVSTELRETSNRIGMELNINPKTVWNNLYSFDKLFTQEKKYNNAKLAVLAHYSEGNIKCAHCGVKDIRILSIDHIKGDGYKSRTTEGGGNRLYNYRLFGN